MSDLMSATDAMVLSGSTANDICNYGFVIDKRVQMLPVPTEEEKAEVLGRRPTFAVIGLYGESKILYVKHGTREQRGVHVPGCWLGDGVPARETRQQRRRVARDVVKLRRMKAEAER